MSTRSVSIRGTPVGSVALQVSEALDAGFERVGIVSPLYQPDVESLLAALPAESVCSIELFLPLPRDIRPEQRSPFRLGSPRAEDKRDAVAWGIETLRFADRHHIPTVWIPPVGLDPELRNGQRRFREGPRLTGLDASLRATRSASLGSRPLDAFLSVLARLLEEAADLGVSIALTPGGWVDELPDSREVAVCLREFRGAPLGLWPDTANLVLADDFAGDSSGESTASWRGAEPILGVTIRDLDESGGPAFPGEGSIQWRGVGALLAASPVWLVDPPEGARRRRVAEAAEFLDRLELREDYGF